jgi:hypothetical protein
MGRGLRAADRTRGQNPLANYNSSTEEGLVSLRRTSKTRFHRNSIGQPNSEL